MEKTLSVDRYIEKQLAQRDLLKKLRKIINLTSLNETIKWGMPTYTHNNKNVLGLGAYKKHVGLWFFQGSLLNDIHNRLTNAQEGKTKAMRQMRFEELDDINEKIILYYIEQTIVNFNKGLVVKAVRKTEEIIIPAGLLSNFKKSAKLEASFNELTPGRKREYIDYINSAKRDPTKLNRLEKIIPLIIEKKGLYDKYKNC